MKKMLMAALIAGVAITQTGTPANAAVPRATGATALVAAAPLSPTDGSKVPHYFGPYPNWANSPQVLANALVTITGGGGTGAEATATVDPKTGDPIDKVPGVVAARGFELGARTEWIPGLQSSLALWTLDFDSELVYVGDAGATEASRPSTRRGIEWNNRAIPLPWLLIDADLAWTHARFSDAAATGNRIPNAVDKVASVAFSVHDLGPWSASLQWRYLGAGALTEDDSERSRSSLTTNLRVGRRFGPGTELTLDVFNLFDRRVNDIEYFYASRLPGEAAPVADRHMHPAEPRTLRLTLRKAF